MRGGGGGAGEPLQKVEGGKSFSHHEREGTKSFGVDLTILDGGGGGGGTRFPPFKRRGGGGMGVKSFCNKLMTSP